MIQEAGTYAAHCVGAYNYEKEGKHILRLDYELEDSPGETISFYQMIAKADGTIMTRGIDALRRVYPDWDGVDPYWFEDYDTSATVVDLVVEMQPGMTDPSRLYPRVKWVNPQGSRGVGGSTSDPPHADRAAFMAKFGSKLRANAGASSARPGPPKPAPVQTKAPEAPKAETPPSRPVAVPARPPAPKPVVPPRASSQNSAWDLCCKFTKDLTEDKREEIWFKAIDATGKTQDAMDASDWAAVEVELEKLTATPDDVAVPF